MAPSDDDEADGVGVTRRELKEETDKLKAAMDKQKESTDTIASKLDQLIKQWNNKALGVEGSANQSTISGVGTRFGPAKENGKVDKGKGVKGGRAKAKNTAIDPATSSATATTHRAASESDSGDSSSSQSSSKRKKKKKKNEKKDTDHNSDSEEDQYDPFNMTGYVYDDDSADEDDEGNPIRHGGRRRQPFTIGIDEFNFGAESADWTSWVKKFQSTVKNACNPKTVEEHHKYNLKWISTKLNTTAHDLYLGCRHRGKNWPKLVKELEEAFDDPEVKQRWSTDLKAYVWDEKSPLHVYKGNVMRYVNKFDSEIRGCGKALRKAYYSRFVGGMPDDFVNFIETALYDDKRTIDRALKVAQQFQIVKKRAAGKAGATKETAAAGVAFHDNYGSERIQALEQNIAKLTTETNTLRNKVTSSDQHLTKDAGNTPAAERSRPKYRHNDQGHRSPSQSYNHSGHSTGRSDNSQNRSQERRQNRDRLNNYKKKYSYQPNDGRNSQQGSNRGSDNQYSRFRKNFDAHKNNKKQEEGGLNMASEVESADEADTTIVEWMAYREMNEDEDFTRFKADKDSARKGF